MFAFLRARVRACGGGWGRPTFHCVKRLLFKTSIVFYSFFPLGTLVENEKHRCAKPQTIKELLLKTRFHLAWEGIQAGAPRRKDSLSAILDLFASNPFMSCPWATSFFLKLVPCPLPSCFNAKWSLEQPSHSRLNISISLDVST